MAARNLPELALSTIPISPGGTVPAGNAYMNLGPLDSIKFHNLAGFAVNIVFTNVFPTINNLANNSYSGTMGGTTALNVTLNFKIVDAISGKTTGGPYAIQFGIGPLPITLSSLDTSPDPVAVPIRGQIQFTADVAYNIGWTIGGQPAPGVWAPQPTVINAGLNPPQTAQAGADAKSLAYAISYKNTETRGGGTVKVGS
jgi:hypothetical protein